MSTQEIIISVDMSQVQEIETIAKENETIFISFEDFVREAIGVYINWWNNPAQSEMQFMALLPHMKLEMIKSIEAEMEDDAFAFAMKGVPEKREKLPKLEFHPLSDLGIQRFSPTPRQLRIFQELIQD